MEIIRAIVAGQHDSEELVKYRDNRCKNPLEMMIAALSGNYKPEHVFALKQSLELVNFYARQVADCDAVIELKIKQLQQQVEPPEKPLSSKKQGRSANALTFDARTELYNLLGIDLTAIHSIGSTLALKLISECGTDISKWPTAKHFTSWLCLVPGNKISGGKILSSKIRKSSNRAVAMLRLVVPIIGKSRSALFHSAIKSAVTYKIVSVVIVQKLKDKAYTGYGATSKSQQTDGCSGATNGKRTQNCP